MCPVAARVPLVGNADHQVGEHGELKQSVEPVAAVLLSSEILHFAAEGESAVEFVLRFGHADVGVDHAAFAFNDGFVVTLIHVHGVDAERRGDLFFELKVYVGVVERSASEEAGFWAVGAVERCVAVFPRVFAVKTAYVAHVKAEFGAVASAHGGALAECVGEIAL